MTMKQRYGPARLFFAIVGALLISRALILLAEYFEWHLLREAGGTDVSRISHNRPNG
jgi:hypothetical protein